jgi:hypothetical protein
MATMKVVGVMAVRNAEACIQARLDAMAQYCDGIFVCDDRSEDGTADLAARHSAVRKCVRMSASCGTGNWYFAECDILNTLYCMAEGADPDWVVRLDSDEFVEPAPGLRAVLADQGADVSGVRFPRVSLWEDDAFPDMVPLMSRAQSMQGSVWRGYKGLRADQPLHNLRMPEGVGKKGRLVNSYGVTFYHTGWSTLAKRIAKAKAYTEKDPEAAWNHGVAYDRGLLFGYALNQLDELIGEYRRRYGK